MNLMFNITSTQDSKKEPIKKEINLVKIKPRPIKKTSTKSEYNFTAGFSKTNTIKAFVAKRRPLLKNNYEKNGDAEKSLTNTFQVKNYVTKPLSNTSDDDNEKQISVKKNYVMRPKDDDEDIEEIDNSKPTFNISLNVVTSNEIPFTDNKTKNIKLTRTERINKKREQKFNKKNEKNCNKVLTETEIDEGIKKHSKVPSKIKKQKKPTICSNIGTKLLGQRLIKPIIEKVFTGCSLETLNIHPHIVKDLGDLLNINELTAVQQKAIPKILEGCDLLVRSQTGSGKTLAYALPIVQKLQEIQPKISRNSGIMALIVVPTRELAIQTYEFLIKLLKPFTWIVSGYLCGGEKRKSEKARLRKGINILVGTTGRLLDHITNTDSCKLDKLQFLVLDEADRLLEFGYEKEVSKIVHSIDEHKRNAEVADEFRPTQNNNEEKIEKPFQRLLLSATLTPAIQKLAGLTLKNPLFIDNNDEINIKKNENTDNYENAVENAIKEGKLILPENLRLSYVVVHPKLRLVTLSGILAKEFKNRQTKVLVFLATTEMVNFLHDLLNETLTMRVLDEDDEPNEGESDEIPLLSGVKFFKLHGSMTQIERGSVFKAFKNCNSGILLTTDVAGRGIDVPEVDLVIQYSPPQTIADFVHRVGRTARAGKSGWACLFLSAEEVEFIQILEDKRIRISQDILEKFLQSLKDADLEAHTVQEAASNLQHKFEDLIEDDKELYEKACKAYSSWVRNYAAYPKELKPIFNIKRAHMGHYVKSFALKDAPTKFISKHSAPKAPLPVNRLTNTDREQKKEQLPDIRKRKHNFSTTVSGGQRLLNISKNSSSHTISSNKLKNNSIENKMAQLSKQSIMMSVSEFDSGIPSKKRKN